MRKRSMSPAGLAAQPAVAAQKPLLLLRGSVRMQLLLQPGTQREAEGEEVREAAAVLLPLTSSRTVLSKTNASSRWWAATAQLSTRWAASTRLAATASR